MGSKIRNRLIQLGIVVLFFSTFFIPNVKAATLLAPQTVISRNVPAYTNNDYNGALPASLANNTNYNDFWISNNVPAYLAYDLSGVPVGQRGQVILVWYNDPATKPFNPALIGDVYYRVPENYTIEANAAPGGSFPASGWVTLATVTSNPYTSRQHLIDLTGYNWVRMNISSCPGVFSIECSVNMDIQNAANGASDDWIFLGDSITSIALDHDPLISDGGTGTFSQLINAQNSNYFPVEQNGGIGGWATPDPLVGSPTYFSTWLSLFPGNFVALDYGTNDANNNNTTGGNPDPTAVNTFYTNMTTMVQAIIAAGKTPVIPKIPWGNTANIQANGPAMNAKIDQLYTDFPEIVPGPDLWTYFLNHQSEISGDNVHPNNTGFVGMRQQWANKMITEVYTTPTVNASPAGGSFSSTQSVSLSGSANATFYYTTNGTTPTTSSTKYTSAISIPSTTTLKFIAVNKGLNVSGVSTETYTIITPTPTFTPTPTSTPVPTQSTSSPSSSSSSSNSSNETKRCTLGKPGVTVPSLYGAIAHDSSSIEIFFTKADNPVDHYTLAYGTSSGNYQYGIDSFGSIEKEQQSYTVKSLQPNTTYYFKVRGGNGCAPGEWSNEISTTTKPLFATNQLDFTSSSLAPIKDKPEVSKTSDIAPTPTPEVTTYSIKISVKDTQDKPVEGAVVTMHSKVQTAKTDKEGIAHFDNVEKGEHKVLISYNNYQGEQALNLNGDVTEYNLNVKVQPQNVFMAPQVMGIIGILSIIILVLLFKLWSKKRGDKQHQ
jgi:hypothetical protein